MEVAINTLLILLISGFLYACSLKLIYYIDWYGFPTLSDLGGAVVNFVEVVADKILLLTKPLTDTSKE